MRITVGQFKEMLEGANDDDELSFSGLDFYRLKRRGDDLIQVEFDQHVYKESATGKVKIENFD